MNRIEVLQALKRYYSSELAEDKQDGTNFDCAVLDALDNLITAQQSARPRLVRWDNAKKVYKLCPNCKVELVNDKCGKCGTHWTRA